MAPECLTAPPRASCFRFSVAQNRFSHYPAAMQIVIPTLPLPLIGALVLFWLLARLLAQGARGWFAGLVAICAAQSLLIALVHHYGLSALARLQALGASLIPPVAWLALVSAGIRPLARRDLAHLAVPVAMLGALATGGAAIDALLMLAFAGYGAAILWALRGGADALPQNRLQGGERAALVWRLIGGGLILSGLSELVIGAAFALGHPGLVGWIIGGYSAGLLLALGVLSLSQDLSTPPATPDPPPDPARDADDAALVARLRALLARDPLHRDPDLTLARLARRLGVPAKTLSAAINRHTGENVSRLINAQRIDEACAHLRNGASVTQAMLDAGFNTKSTFNREFRRITSQSPTDWRG